MVGTAGPGWLLSLLPQVGGAVAPRGSCGGYRWSWVVTLPPATGRRSGGTQGQLWWAPLLLGTAAPSTPVKYIVYDSL